MSDKSLKDKAIKIQGKDYVLVSDRVNYFNDNYPNGSIETRLVSQPSDNIIVVKAVVTPDCSKPERQFTDYAQEVIGSTFINKTSAMENASTSAVGRALAYMGIGVVESIASADEINKAGNRTAGETKTATEKQLNWMLDEAEKKCGSEDAYKWLTKLLTVKPEDVPVYKVKDAIDLIRKQTIGELETDGVVVTDQDIIDLEEGNVPY